MITIEWKFGNETVTFTKNELMSASGATNQALIAEALESDTFNFEAVIPTSWPASAQAAAIISGWKYGQTLILRRESNNAIIGKFYLANVAHQGFTRDGRARIRFESVSFVGLTVEMTHVGGMFTNAKSGDVIAGILGATEETSKSTATRKAYRTAAGITYTVDTAVANARVDGHLPYADGANRTARDNLRDVLFSCGASLLKDANGDARITFNQPDEPKNVPDSRIYEGDRYGNTETVTDVAVVEHGFYVYMTPSTEPSLLFQTGSDVVSNVLVVFKEPVFNLEASSGLTINERSTNHAIVSGSGRLTGIPFTHTMVTHTRHIADGVPRAKTADVSLVSGLNAEAVLDRMANYYSHAKEVHARFVVDDEIKTGALISFNDPGNTLKTGYIKRNNFNVSGTDAGDAVVVVDWRPTSTGNEYDISQTLTGSGTWSKAAAEAAAGKPINRMRVVMISGASGGEPGNSGKAGVNAGAGGAGGLGGLGGEGGRVVSIELTEVPASINFACGVGGAQSSSGTDTTVTINGTTFTTAQGVVPAAGVMNVVTGELSALRGDSGVNGGAGWGYGSSGNAGESVTFNGVTYNGGSINTNAKSTSWRDVYVENNGTPSARVRVDLTSSGLHEINVSGSGGGGAAVGNDGSAGGPASIGTETEHRDPSTGRYYVVRVSSARSGYGGNGASAVDRTETPALGCGGFGGHGGGGGGCSGKATGEYGGSTWSSRTSGGNITITVTKNTYPAVVAPRGAGGSGGAGSVGGAGLIWLIY